MFYGDSFQIEKKGSGLRSKLPPTLYFKYSVCANEVSANTILKVISQLKMNTINY